MVGSRFGGAGFGGLAGVRLGARLRDSARAGLRVATSATSVVCLAVAGVVAAGGCAQDTSSAAGTGGAIGTGGVAGGGGGVSGSGGAGNRGGTGGGTIGTGGVSGSTGTGGGAGRGTGGVAGSAATAFVCPPGPFAAPAIAGVVPARIAAVPPHDAFNNNGNNFSVIEGPVWIGDALYVSEIQNPVPPVPPPSRILKVTAAGDVTIELDDAGANGMAVDASGDLVACNHKDGAVTQFTLPSFTPTALVSTYGGARFDSPNDLAFGTNGDLYFSDPDHQTPTPIPQARTRLYRVPAGTSTAMIVDENRSEPNGVTFSLDGRTLFVTGQDGLFRYPLASDGTVGTGTKIVPQIGQGDGMVVDCGGNLYVATNNTLVVLDSAQNMLGTITVPGIQAVTNAAFGGADHKTLYITALGSGTQAGLFAVPMNLPGNPY